MVVREGTPQCECFGAVVAAEWRWVMAAVAAVIA
jgi:hypothetical protein